MAARSRKSPKAQKRQAAARPRAAELFTRQRLVAGGLTAFAVAFSYVSANAIWYQPHAHKGTFFATRPASDIGHVPAAEAAASVPAGEIETVFRIERPAPGTDTNAAPPDLAPAVAPAPAPPRPDAGAAPEPAQSAAVATGGDERVRAVQTVLARLNLYPGAIDGLTGPQTRAAVEAYQRTVGLEVTGRIDDALMRQLGEAAPASASVPVLPSVAPIPATDQMVTASSTREPDGMVVRIQAGLRAFGNDAIVADGQVGEKTRAALLEFQALFGLPKTGRPDPEVYAKMQEIGLTN